MLKGKLIIGATCSYPLQMLHDAKHQKLISTITVTVSSSNMVAQVL